MRWEEEGFRFSTSPPLNRTPRKIGICLPDAPHFPLSNVVAFVPSALEIVPSATPRNWKLDVLYGNQSAKHRWQSNFTIPRDENEGKFGRPGTALPP